MKCTVDAGTQIRYQRVSMEFQRKKCYEKKECISKKMFSFILHTLYISFYFKCTKNINILTIFTEKAAKTLVSNVYETWTNLNCNQNWTTSLIDTSSELCF